MKKLMYIWLLILMATSVAAQEPYVIDSVCINGMDRYYRIVGEDGYLYEWDIIDTTLKDTIFVNGTDIAEIDGTDTTWINEIVYIWDRPGVFEIIVKVSTEHSCDTMEQGIVKVFEQPGVYAGRDSILCTEITEMVLTGDTAWNYTGIYWETLGDGTFDNIGRLHPTYTFGPTDIASGEVTLYLTAEGLSDNGTCYPAVDSITWYFSKPEITLFAQDPLCYNDSNGYIVADITGGLPPYNYSWEGPPGFVSQNNDSIGGLWAGIYILTVSDANSCIDKDTIEIVNPPELFVSIDSSQNVSCYGYADGFIFSSAIGGTGTISYAWTGPNGYTASEDSIFNLSGGMYILTIIDENGCEETDSIFIEEPDPLIVNIDTVFDVQCYGYYNGAAHVSVIEGGTGPYTYSWNTTPVQDSAWAINLGPGEYIVTVTDVNGCMVWDTVTISEPEPIAIIVDSIDVRCDGAKPGEIHLQVTGGNRLANAPFYYFEWRNESDSLIATTQDVTGLEGNQYYTVLVTDSLNCQETRRVYINEIEMMEMEVSIDSALCYGDLWNIYLTVFKGNPNPSYVYEWSDTSGTVIGTTDELLGIPSGIYTVNVYDADSCVLTEVFDLEDPPLLITEITADDTILCYGEMTFVHGNPVGGTGTLTQTWTGSGAYLLNSTTQTNVIFDNATPGSYQLIYTIVDEENCVASDTIEINVYPPSYNNDTMEVCAYSAPFQYSENIIVTSDMDRIYRDTLVNQYGCDSIITLDVKVLFPEFLDSTLYVCENEEPFVMFNNTIIPGRDSIYFDTIPYVETGCDSLLITLNVVTLPVTYAFFDTTLCAGADTFLWVTNWIQTDSSQVYLDTLENSFGCDSLMTFNVTILPPDTFYVDTTFCQDEPDVVWNEIDIQTVSDSIYEVILPNMLGCDSIVYLTVTIIPSTDTLITETLCYGDSIDWIGRTIYAYNDSIYLDTLTNVAGCDSLVIFDVSVVHPDTINLDTSLCLDTPPFAWGTNNQLIFTQYDSVYSETLQNWFGCDSTVYLAVNILMPRDSIDTIEICANEPSFLWSYGHHTILPDRDSIYYDTLYYAAGCDSLRLQLTVISHPVNDTIITMTVCEGSDSIPWNGRMIATFLDSIYVDTLQNQWYCDSIVTLIIDVVPAYKDTIVTTICYGEPLADWYGQAISSEVDSIYIQPIPGPSVCDTLLFYEVTILPVTDSLLEFTYCADIDSVLMNNIWIQKDTSRVYYDVMTNSYGCDSLLTYNVTILQPDTILVYDTLYYGEIVDPWNGLAIQSFTDSVYLASLQNELTCDSIVFLYTTIVKGSYVELDTIVCESFTWLDGDGKTYERDTVVDYIFGNVNYADTMRLILKVSQEIIIAVNPVNIDCYGDSTGSINVSVISGGIGPFTYEWSTGDTTQNLSNLPAGDYEVTVKDIVGCETFFSIPILQPDSISIELETIVHVEVNGESTGSIDVSVGGGTPFAVGDRYIYEWTNENGDIVGTDEDLFSQPAGEYTLTVTDANDCENTRTYIIEEPEITVCIDDVELTCYEDLDNYPLITSLEEYLTYLTATQVIDPGCGIDTSSFTSNKIVDNNSIYCYEELRTYTLLDICNGDTIFYCEQHVIVNDTEDPEIICADISVSNGIIPAPYADTTEFKLDRGKLSDNCGIVDFYQVGSDVSDGGTNPERITRVYEVIDFCGNTARCVQTIEVFADVDIALVCEDLPDVYYECRLANIPSHKTLEDYVADGGKYYSSIDIDTFYYTDKVTGTYCPTVERTFYLINVAGDADTCSHTFEVIDDIAPGLNLPDVNLYCDESLPSPFTTPMDIRRKYSFPNYSIDTIMWDNCDINAIRFVSYLRQEVVEGCPTVITRYYRIADWCGNYEVYTEKIFIHDTIPPVITNFDEEITAECDFPDPSEATFTVSDDCSPVQIFSRDSIDRNDPGVLYRIYTFTDGCNPVVKIQKITIEFTNEPVFAAIDPMCQFSVAPALPDTSLNGLTGFWLPDTILTDEAGTFEFMFYPDSGQCAVPASIFVQVTPAVVVSLDTVINQGYNPKPVGEIVLNVDGGTPDFIYEWSNGETTQNISDLYADTYTMQVTDAIGCIDSITVEITAGQPEFSCPPDTIFECPDVSQYPPVTSIDEFIAIGGVYDPIEIVSGISSFDDTITSEYCLTILRTYVVENIYGQVDSCPQRIDFHDTIPPVITAPEGEEAECVSTVIPDIETLDDFIAFSGTVSDNCTIDPSSFTVSEPRIERITSSTTEVTIVYSISDICGNVSYDSTIYIATDTIAPEVICRDITVYLDEDGNYELTEIDLDTLISDATADNCTPFGDLIVQVDYDQFTCVDVDELNELTVTVFDMAGNSGVCTATVTVIDTFPPEAICKPDTVYLDEYGHVTISVDMIDNGSTDNCWPVDTMFLSQYEFDCYDVGENPVTLVVVDQHGKVDSCESIVTVIDTIPPVVSCVPPFIVQLDENAQYSLSVFDIYVDSDDECGIDTMYLDIYELNCDHIGITPITVTVVDRNGNVSYCTTEITVFGNIAPIAQNDSAVTLVNEPKILEGLLDNDYDQQNGIGIKTKIDENSMAIKIDPRHGELTKDPETGVITYIPATNFVGYDTLVYSICDDAIPCVSMCDSAFVFIQVLPLNNPPVARDNYYTATCDEAEGNLLDNDDDPDYDQISINTVPIVLPIHGYIIIQEDGSFIYTPDEGFNGTDSLMYEICDDGYPALCSTAWVYITKYPDADCDGIPDVDDIDDDDDGILDIVEGNRMVDTDGDGIPDSLDIDSDNDGIPDNIEGQGEFDYNVPLGIDANNNGWDDRYDPLEGGNEFVPEDTDGDGIPDYLDEDSDGDGVMDFIEGHDLNADGIPDVLPIFIDTDRDGLDDIYDIVNGASDPYSVINSLGSNAPLQDFDGDGTRDWRDTNDEDDEFMTVDEDNNHDEDYSNDDLDLDGYPDYLDKTLDCELFIPEGFSPNDDGVHDFFQILCIQKYPNAHLMIFNRNGDKLFEKEHYGNLDVWVTDEEAWWWGTSENRFTIGRMGGLPAANYVYVLDLGNGEVKNGTVMIEY